MANTYPWPQISLGHGDGSACCLRPISVFSNSLSAAQMLRVATPHFSYKKVACFAVPKTSENGENEEGNPKVQDILVEMVKLQSESIQVEDFVEQKSKQLTDIAEDAKAESYRIAESALRNVDEMGSKVLEDVEADVQELEEQLAFARAEMEMDQREFEQFEKKVETSRNENLFFKGLYKSTKPKQPQTEEEKAKIAEATKPLVESSKKSASSRFRRVVYGGFIILLSLTLVDALISGNADWSKLGIYAAFLVLLILQLVYERNLGREDNGPKND